MRHKCLISVKCTPISLHRYSPKSHRLIPFILTFVILLGTCFFGCSPHTLLSPDDPAVLRMWHVYGEQATSPMNLLIQEFNQTEGSEKGVIIDVTLMSSSSKIGELLMDAYTKKPGAPAMPDIFSAYPKNALDIGTDNLVNWSDYFSKEEIDKLQPSFVEEGMLEDRFSVFPLSKSTHLLFVNGSLFERFSKETGISEEAFKHWDSFYEAASAYYEWSNGKAFCAFDYPMRTIELDAISRGSKPYTEDGWYDKNDKILKDAWDQFANSFVRGHVIISDLYSNTQIMTGEVLCGISSSAAILYYNDQVTYPDGTKEFLNLKVFPIPATEGVKLLATQRGMGICALKGDTKKEEAASIFLHWMLEKDRNLVLASEMGYMPVQKTDFSMIRDMSFDQPAYQQVYEAIFKINESSEFRSEPAYAGYDSRINNLYEILRNRQNTLPEELIDESDVSGLAEETWSILYLAK